MVTATICSCSSIEETNEDGNTSISNSISLENTFRPNSNATFEAIFLMLIMLLNLMV